MAEYFAHETAVVDDGCVIGAGTKIWHFTHIMAGCRIGEKCNIGQNVVISPDVVLGNNVKIQNNVSVYTGVTCDDETHVGRGATIGANATIVCGHDIGEYAFIGAGAVVTKTVAPYALMVGNPARQTGWMSEFGCKLKFDTDGFATCPQSGDKYQLKNGIVNKLK